MCFVAGTATTIEWGDGTTTTSMAQGATYSDLHTYASAGDYVITVTGSITIDYSSGSSTADPVILAYNNLLYSSATVSNAVVQALAYATAALYSLSV